MDYDLIVVGGGAGGLGAARMAHRLGAKTLLVQDGPIGGDCTFTGCVPSKAIIAAAAAGNTFTEAFAGAREIVAEVAATESAEVLRGEGIEVIDDFAEFTSPTSVSVGGRELGTPKFIVSSGSRPAVPPIPGLDETPHLTNENLFDLTAPMASLAILGGGPIGCELAQALARLGVAVTLFEMADRLLLKEEAEACEVIRVALTQAGVDVRLGAKVVGVSSIDGGGVNVEVEGAGASRSDEILVAVGRVPSSRGFGLEELGVTLDRRGHVETDERLRTSVENIWAVGDVTGKLPFTHAADEMGRLAATNAVDKGGIARMRPGPTFRTEWIPWTTFTDPEVARVGMTEAEAAAVGGRVAYLPMTENDRAIASRRTEGFVKLIAGPKRFTRHLGGGEILGATIVAPRAGEMIHEPALAMRTKMFAGRLAQTVHAYPTWSIGIQKAAAQFFYEIEGRSATKARVPKV